MVGMNLKERPVRKEMVKYLILYCIIRISGSKAVANSFLKNGFDLVNKSGECEKKCDIIWKDKWKL